MQYTKRRMHAHLASLSDKQSPHRRACGIQRKMLRHIAQAVVGQALPERGVLIQAHDGGGERICFICHAHVLAIVQVHAFHRAGGAHHWLAVRHAQVDLALDAGTEAQRRHCNTQRVHVRHQIRHVPMQLHARRFIGQ